MRGAIEQELERLQRLGIIEQLSYSDWVAPVVPVTKADGSIHLCGDYKVTVNPVMKVHQFPVPTPEDLFATLAGGTAFTKLNLYCIDMDGLHAVPEKIAAILEAPPLE